jgi:DNA-binding transcriptional ArsR family regulator
MSGKNSKTIGRSMEETKEYHIRYLRAINSPLRRSILRILKERAMTIIELIEKTGLNRVTLEWHMNILENGFSIEKVDKFGEIFYRLTQEGLVVDFVDE